MKYLLGEYFEPEMNFTNSNISFLRSIEMISKATCAFVYNLPIDEQCDFVTDTPDCESGSLFANCIHILFCIPVETRYIPIIIMPLRLRSSWLRIFMKLLEVKLLMVPLLFSMLTVVSDEFFCPALSNLSELLGLSESLAGVTILAFGNGAPDLLTNIGAPVKINVKFLYSQLLGNSVYLTTVVAGMIMIICPFRLVPRAFVRDCIFFICSVLWLSYMFDDLQVSFYEPIGLMCIYIIYIISIIIFEKYLISKHLESAVVTSGAKRKQVEEVTTPGGFQMLVPKMEQRKPSFLITPDVVTDLRRKKALKEIGLGEQADEERNRNRLGHLGDAGRNLFSDFFRYMNPIPQDQWKECTVILKIFYICKAPLLVLYKLLIPVVNYTEYNHHWCKLARCINFIMMAMLILWGFKLLEIEVAEGIPLWPIIMGGALCCAILVFFTSHVKEPPKYHKIFIFCGFFASMVNIFLIATEIVEILMAFGLVMQISPPTLGLSVLTWGNAIGDITSNIIIARAGYPRMAFAACYGGPMFNMLIGLGLIFSRFLIEKRSWHIALVAGKFANNCDMFLFYILGTSLLFIPIFRYQARKFFGCYLINIYVIFLIYSALCELYILHPLGVKHKIYNETVVL